MALNKTAQGSLEYLLVLGVGLIIVSLAVVGLTGIAGSSQDIAKDNNAASTLNPLQSMHGECNSNEKTCRNGLEFVCESRKWVAREAALGVCDAECTTLNEEICGHTFLEEGDPNSNHNFVCGADFKLVDNGVSLSCGAACLLGQTDQQNCGCNSSGTQTRDCGSNGYWQGWNECVNQTYVCTNFGESTCKDYRTKSTCNYDGCGYTLTSESGKLCEGTNLIQRFASGSGTVSDPFVITQCNSADNGLTNIGLALDKNFALGSNITCNSVSNFSPIPNFSGNLNGNNYTISYLKIALSGGSAGLFANATNAKFSNLKFSNGTIRAGNDSGLGESSIGTLAGSCSNCIIDKVQVLSGTINSFHSTINPANNYGGIVGSIDSQSTVSGAYAKVYISTNGPSGGLVGNSSGKILNSYADANVVTYYYSGGIIAKLNSPGQVINSYTKGTVLGGSDTFVGGIAGIQYDGSLIQNSYSDANVNFKYSSIGSYFGGIAGKTNSGNCTIKNSYFTGILPTVNYGGIVGSFASNTGSVSNSFTSSNKCTSSSANICTISVAKNLFYVHNGSAHAVYYTSPVWDTNWAWTASALPTLQ